MADYDQYCQLWVVAEHRLARLEQLGIRQARYFGRVTTKLQLYLAAMMTHLTFLANQTGAFGDPSVDYAATVIAPRDNNPGMYRHYSPAAMPAWLRAPIRTLALFPSRAFRLAFLAVEVTALTRFLEGLFQTIPPIQLPQWTHRLVPNRLQ